MIINRSVLNSPVSILFFLFAFGLLSNKANAQVLDRCGDTERIKSVSITSSEIEPKELRTVLATQEPSFFSRLFRVGKYPCADTLELRRDALRIAVLHRQRGWFQAAVDPVLDSTSDGLALTFNVKPGSFAIIRNVTVQGLPDSTSSGRLPSSPLKELEGEVFDRVRVQEVTDRLVDRLQESGYARVGHPAMTVEIDSSSARVDLEFIFSGGMPLTTGALTVDITPVSRRAARFDSADVVKMSGLEMGRRYNSSEILSAQRRLYQTEAFGLVLIDTVTPLSGSSDSTIDLRITVAEAKTRTARAGIGWGTLECGRVQGRITDRSFLGPGRRIEFLARASRIGTGAPVDQFPGLCTRFLRDDPYSQELNYHLGLSLTSASFFGLQMSPSLSVYSERRGEYNAFQRETDIGINAVLSRSLGPRTSISTGLEYESGRTVTDAILACVRFALCQPTDFELARQGNSSQAANLSWVHDRVSNQSDPRHGGRMMASIRAGRTSFRGIELPDGESASYSFYRPSLEATGFSQLWGGTIAARVQWSQVYTSGGFRVAGIPFISPQDRLFSGGQNTVRGYQQNLLGPVIYRVDRAAVDSVPFKDSWQFVVNPEATARIPSPEGGTASLVSNIEYRTRFSWPSSDLQWVFFLDAGTVLASSLATFSMAEVRATPGIGMRMNTPIGPFRVDIGYNPRRADAGKAFLFDSVRRSSGGQAQPYVICVSPGQELTFDEQLDAGGFECPRTFTPVGKKSLLSRLVFHFSIGQAF